MFFRCLQAIWCLSLQRAMLYGTSDSHRQIDAMKNLNARLTSDHPMKSELYLRALERQDLRFIHNLNNNRNIMSYWFEEPYESFDELEELYNKHIHDNAERRFVVENENKQLIGLVELIEINYIHRSAEFQIIITPEYQGRGYALDLINKALDYSFTILNLHKIYLHVAIDNEVALYLYRKAGFVEEGHLIEEFFINGRYQDVKRMYILQHDYLKKTKALSDGSK